MSGANNSTGSIRAGELNGKVAMVTGSSSGIGRAIALELAAAGADVIVHARSNRTGAEQTQQDILATDSAATVLMADLADAASHEWFVEQAWNWRGGLDIWINNAGADVLTGEAASFSFDKKLEMLWQIDVTATVRLSRLIGKRMQQHARGDRDRPVILNMGWDRAEQGMSGDSGEMFSAVKGAIMAFTRSLAHSLAPDVRVNCLAPGWIKTKWGDSAADYWQQRAAQESLLKRWGTPADVAGVARFLASPAASFITGQVVPINGGLRGGAT